MNHVCLQWSISAAVLGDLGGGGGREFCEKVLLKGRPRYQIETAPDPS